MLIRSDVIIIGGGPAGMSCARELRRRGRQSIILDKDPFPRSKLCTGWITPSVLRNLGIRPQDYPFGMITMKRLAVYFFGRRFIFPTRQYSIRRDEFDSWLLEQTGVTVFRHRAQDIRKDGKVYIIDDAFECRHLVGAGGTYCPVYTTFFRDMRPRAQDSLVIALEKEFPHNGKEKLSRLWLFEPDLPGYAWYIAKEGGFISVGVGGRYALMKKKHMSIRDLWNSFTERFNYFTLEIDHHVSPRGYGYYIRHDSGPVQVDNAYLVGDSAGLATIDMGEGIGPAVYSGILAARAIVAGKPYSPASIGRFSLKDILIPGRA